ncbi:MAG: hypothetical protein Q7K34_04585 [archaeon]|nr:hypothetical protein [archaeon]
MELFVTRPQHDDTTFYLSKWVELVFPLCREKGIKISDFEKKRANAGEVAKFLKNKNPRFAVFNGHGDEETITGHKNEVLIKNGKNQELLKGKIVYAVACDCASVLGKESIKSGTIVFIGYETSFIFVYDPNSTATPTRDEMSLPVFESSNEVLVSLIKGNSAQEAYEKSQSTFDKWIKKLQRSDAPPEAQHILMTLYWNKAAQAVHGDKNAKLE